MCICFTNTPIPSLSDEKSTSLHPITTASTLKHYKCILRKNAINTTIIKEISPNINYK